MATINGSGRNRTIHLRAAAFATLVALGVSACGGDNDQATSSSDAAAPADFEMEPTEDGGLATVEFKHR